MDEFFKKQTITLIGPGGVGKSLIAKELSKKSNLPIISIDKIYHYIIKDMIYNFEGHNHKKGAEKIRKSYMSTLKKEKDPVLKEKQLSLVDEAVEDYLRYAKMFAGFKSFYDITDWHEDLLGHIVEPTNEEVFAINQMYAIELIKIIFDKLDSPVIFDMGATFGWFAQKEYNLYINGYLINSIKLNNEMADIMADMGTIVFIEPSEDYMIRRPEKKNPYNAHLIKNFNNYYDNSHVSISTSGMFYDPKDKSFEQRLMFDAKSKQQRENLMNHSDIDSICYQILEAVENYNAYQYE